MDDLISRQAAIEAIKRAIWDKYTAKDAIDAVCNVPSAEPEYRLDEWCTDCKEYDQERNCCPRVNHVIRATLQEVQTERKKGRWIETDDGWDGVYYECSCCKEAFTLIDGTPTDNLYNYCPNCGAEMRGEEDG